MSEELINGRTLREWKEYSERGGSSVQVAKYIHILESKVTELQKEKEESNNFKSCYCSHYANKIEELEKEAERLEVEKRMLNEGLSNACKKVIQGNEEYDRLNDEFAQLKNKEQ